MKKQIQSNIHTSTQNHINQQNQTRPSIKKHIQKCFRRAISKNNPKTHKQEVQTQHSAKQPILKDTCQSSETASDTPSNVNVLPYMDEIYHHISELDKKFHSQLSSNLKGIGSIQITLEMRKILVKWLMRVGSKIRAGSETMHMCVQLIDIMMIKRGELLNKSNFQLLGVTCLFMSCKYSQIYTIESHKYIQFCDGIYGIAELLEMESLILSELGFNLQIPTYHQFLQKYIRCEEIAQNQNMKIAIKDLMDMVMYDFNIFNCYGKLEMSIAIVYFISKLYKNDQLKMVVSQEKNSIKSELFKECFMGIVTLFKKNQTIQGMQRWQQ